MKTFPPKIRNWWFVGSHSVPNPSRIEGCFAAKAAGTVLGLACVQVEVAPSHNHVSPSTVKPEAPPNKTSFWIFCLYAIEAAVRTLGATLVLTCTQVVPSKVRVSLSEFEALKPPKITTFLLIGSYADAKDARSRTLLVGAN